ncbi:cytochrome b [Bradyrhizobium sp.]|jgi:cytochrome b561|uniref:cytochrome b n=1 Tax=Bradyrhizobium sp. TaxID=376 RepID=UPI003C215594
MTKNSESTEVAVVAISREDDRFDRTSIILHWLTAFLILAQFVSIWSLEAAGDESSLGLAFLSIHRATGVSTLVAVVARLFWRHYFAYLPPFPPRMPKLQQTIAKANEYGLYILLLAMPITGLARVVLRGQSFDLFVWQVPALMEPNPAMRSLFVEAHEIGAKALMILIGLHAGAALFHRLVLRDGVLQRMLPRMLARAKLTPALAGDDAE